MEKVIDMSNLFIIGNGFDIAHGLPTKYADFKKYLSDRIKINQGIKDNDEDYIKSPKFLLYQNRKFGKKGSVLNIGRKNA